MVLGGGETVEREVGAASYSPSWRTLLADRFSHNRGEGSSLQAPSTWDKHHRHQAKANCQQ